MTNLNRRITKNVLLPVALILAGTAGLVSSADAQTTHHAKTRHHSTKRTQHLSVQELQNRLDEQFNRGIHTMNLWKTEFSISQPDGAGTTIYLNNTKRGFLEDGFGWLSGKAPGVRISPDEGRSIAQRMITIYDEGNALVDTFNNVRDGALDGASVARYEDVLRRTTKHVDNIKSNNEEIDTTAAFLASQVSNNSQSNGWLDLAADLITIWEFFTNVILPLLGLDLEMPSPRPVALLEKPAVSISQPGQGKPTLLMPPRSNKGPTLAA